MKKARLAAISGIGLISIWFGFPIGLTAYVNKKYGQNINVEHIKVAGLIGIDCVQLNNIHINTPSISGVLYSGIACYRNKTIDIDGGKLNVTLFSDKESSEHRTLTHGFIVHVKNIDAHVIKGNVVADISNISGDTKKIYAQKVIVNHPKANAIVFNFCFDKQTNSIMASNGNITPKFEMFGHNIGEIYFTSLFKATKTELSLGEIRYEDNVAYNIQAEIKNDLASIHVSNLLASHTKLFSIPLSVININISNISTKDTLSSNVNISLNDKVSVLVDVRNKHISGKDTCNNWFGVIPKELKNNQIEQMKIKGMFGFDVQFSKPISLKINSVCSIDGTIPEFITDLEKPFNYTAYHPDGTPFERTSGPGTNDWIPLDFVDNMATALTITEDPGFWHHRGIIPQALENSLKDDMRLGKFFRGGSTITMQLAKNLWLNRSRTLGRKLQEGLLTIALESGLSKEKILELYLNVVEFGPNTYGIGPGCAKFLKKFPGEITLSEALYMATRLPSPNRAHSYEANKGFIKKLIAIGVASGKISESELSAELQAEQTKEEADEAEDDENI